MTFVMDCFLSLPLIFFILDDMNAFIDKLILMFGCAGVIAATGAAPVSIAALLGAATLSFLSELAGEQRMRFAIGAFISLVVFSWPYPEVLYALPLIAYEPAKDRTSLLWCTPLFLFASIRLLQAASLKIAATVLGLCIFSVLLCFRSSNERAAIVRQHKLEDTLSDKVLYLNRKNAELEDAREYATQAATLKERTRIARDIHDNVGHILTRLVMQVEALKVVHAQDDVQTQTELEALSSELNLALTSMRESVHMLADSAVDLNLELQRLTRQSGIEDVYLTYTAETNPPSPVVRAIISITREALTNALRHGKATTAAVSVTEFPGFWRLSIKNNGLMPEVSPETHDLLASLGKNGLGLRAMKERVDDIDGTLRISITDEFAVIVTIPKERS